MSACPEEVRMKKSSKNFTRGPLGVYSLNPGGQNGNPGLRYRGYCCTDLIFCPK
jgi:hypothetical protein